RAGGRRPPGRVRTPDALGARDGPGRLRAVPAGVLSDASQLVRPVRDQLSDATARPAATTVKASTSTQSPYRTNGVRPVVSGTSTTTVPRWSVPSHASLRPRASKAAEVPVSVAWTAARPVSAARTAARLACCAGAQLSWK